MLKAQSMARLQRPGTLTFLDVGGVLLEYSGYDMTCTPYYSDPLAVVHSLRSLWRGVSCIVSLGSAFLGPRHSVSYVEYQATHHSPKNSPSDHVSRVQWVALSVRLFREKREKSRLPIYTLITTTYYAFQQASFYPHI